MLGKIFLKIPWFYKKFYRFSESYVNLYRGYSYNPVVNGEYFIIKQILKIFIKKIIFFDVGANVGDWSKFMTSNANDYEAHVFEISKQTYSELKKKFKNNKSSKIYLNNFGLSDKNKIIKFKNYGKSFGGNTILLNANYFNKKKFLISKTKVTRGDDYLKKFKINKINFLKIDVEGAEYFVLNGFKKAFRSKKIDIIQFEYGYTHADVKTLMKDFFYFFEINGYVVGRLESDGVYFKKFDYKDNDFKSGPNYIACLPKFKKYLEK